jgi:putative YjhG/YagF family dehydratase
MAKRSAHALMAMEKRGTVMRDILTDASFHNAMVAHAAFGGSMNLILHVPAIAHSAGLRRPVADDWSRINRQVPRLVDALPNGPYATIHVFMAGGVPEVMLHLRRAGLLETKALTVSGATLDQQLDEWEQSERRAALRKLLHERDGIDPDRVIFSPDSAAKNGMTSTTCFPIGNLAPEGSVIKATAIDPTMVDADGIYRKVGPAKVFLSEPAAVAAIKAKQIEKGDVLVLICRGPMGAGMEETYQLTSALKYLPFGKHVSLLTDARFSGVSTGACIGHVSPEALAGGPIGRLREGDIIEIVIDRVGLHGTVNLVGEGGVVSGVEAGTAILAARQPRPDLAADPKLPDDTRLWAALQDASGGTWGGCVFDTDAILRVLAAGKKALASQG